MRTSGKILATPLFIIPTKISKERINQISREERESNVKRAALDVALTSFNFRCKYCNLAFMNCLFDPFALFVLFSLFGCLNLDSRFSLNFTSHVFCFSKICCQ